MRAYSGTTANSSKYETHLLNSAFDWLNSNLPCPPFRQKLSSGKWTRDAVCWFHPNATEPIDRIWDIVAVLREYGSLVRLVTTKKPGTIVYQDKYQVVAETFPWA